MGSGHNWFLGENPPSFTCILLERVCWEVVFSQRECSTSYGALRLHDLACCRHPEREVKHRWTVLVKVYTPRWRRHVENESP
jgi:hypothetical protein